jgi:hypothetical protein
MEAIRETHNLGQAISRARHQIEGKWGLSTLEVPLSVVCRSRAFRWFAAHLLGQLPRFRAVYNECLAEYRLVHRIRSRTHPVPELKRQNDWLESPFWIWSQQMPRRRRLFARVRGRELELSDRQGTQTVVQLSADGGARRAVEQLGDWDDRGVRLRPRALLTTMFARLLLSDLFVHGIGGAKYDQLTDAIVQRFFGFAAPAFLTLTATIKLPLDRPRASPSDLRRVDWLLRELRYNPQRHVALNESTRPLVDAKRQWVESAARGRDLRRRHHEITQLNAALQPHVEPMRLNLLDDRDRYTRLLRQEKLLGSREYAFCLFPEQTLKRILLDF